MSTNFEDVGRFHEKFWLDHALYEFSPRLIPDELAKFRLKFLAEELNELLDAYERHDLSKIADALVDLVYVAMGTAHLHGLPWEALWNEVQRANMAKERCEIGHAFIPMGDDSAIEAPDCCEQCNAPQHKHSTRGSINDVIKPPGWTAPNIARVLLDNHSVPPQVSAGAHAYRPDRSGYCRDCGGHGKESHWGHGYTVRAGA
jgi:predicted HAD superfamily Cof-like phosphohydrolase